MKESPKANGTHRVEPFYVVGAGGIGCAVGYSLRAAGSPVIFVDVQTDKIE